MAEKYSVAIDGPSGAGKSTLAKAAAAALGICYVDTGAIYRTIGYGVYRRGINPSDAGAVAAVLPDMQLEMRYDQAGLQRMMLAGEDVTDQIRLPEMSRYASTVSAIPAVRDFLLELQREQARRHSVIMDGRDIGTVVLPDATVKISSPPRRRCGPCAASGSWSSAAPPSPMTRCSVRSWTGTMPIPTGPSPRCAGRRTPWSWTPAP